MEDLALDICSPYFNHYLIFQSVLIDGVYGILVILGSHHWMDALHVSYLTFSRMQLDLFKYYFLVKLWRCMTFYSSMPT